MSGTGEADYNNHLRLRGGSDTDSGYESNDDYSTENLLALVDLIPDNDDD